TPSRGTSRLPGVRSTPASGPPHTDPILRDRTPRSLPLAASAIGSAIGESLGSGWRFAPRTPRLLYSWSRHPVIRDRTRFPPLGVPAIGDSRGVDRGSGRVRDSTSVHPGGSGAEVEPPRNSGCCVLKSMAKLSRRGAAEEVVNQCA